MDLGTSIHIPVYMVRRSVELTGGVLPVVMRSYGGVWMSTASRMTLFLLTDTEYLSNMVAV